MGQVQEKEKEIEGERYRVRTLPATEAVDLSQQLTRVMVEGFAAALMQDPEKGIDLAQLTKPTTLGMLLMRSANHAAPGDWSALTKQILKHTLVYHQQSKDYVPVRTIYDDHFAGRLMHLVAVCGWVLSASFGGP